MNSVDFLNKLLSKIDDKNQHLVAWGFLGLILILDFFLILKPQLNKLSQLNPAIQKLSSDLSSARKNISQVNQFRLEITLSKDKLEQMVSAVKKREELNIILQRLSLLANQAGVEIDQIMPNPLAQEEMLKDKEAQYFSLPIFIQAKGGFHSLGRFMNAVENDPMALNVANFTFNSSQSDRVGHLAQLTLKATIFDESNQESSKEDEPTKKQKKKSNRKKTKSQKK